MITFVAVPDAVRANGFRIFDQGASATGQGSAFSAQADDASAVYYNPAGMTQLRGVQFSGGMLFLGGSTSFKAPSGASVTGGFGDSVAYPPPVNLYVTANLKDLGIRALGDTTLGLAVISPFGIQNGYPANGPFATATTYVAVEILDFKPTVAYKLNDQLSFGAGLDIYTFVPFIGQGQAENIFNSAGGPGQPPAGSRIEINGRDTAVGFNFSTMYTPLRNEDGKPLLNVGFVYRSSTALNLQGQFLSNGKATANASTNFVLPESYTLGVAYWPLRDRDREWKLEIDLDYTGWQNFRNNNVTLSTGSTISAPRHWQNATTLMLGTEHKWLHVDELPDWEIAARAGYWYAETPVPDATFNPSLPNANSNSMTLGFGFMCKGQGHFLGFIDCSPSSEQGFGPKAVGVDLAYRAIFYETRTVTGNQAPLALPGVVNGTYNTTLHVGSLNLRVNF
ncbi:MAG: long-chain fatty acid transporter [Nitrospirae bacterium]|nr:MAG: long-chain fatty acid transporter [Nitrospirota bacterium]